MLLTALSLLLCAAPAQAGLAPEDALAILEIEAERRPPLTLAPYLESDEPEVRARAARALGRLRTASALAPLGRLLVDVDPSVRFEAAYALGQTPGSQDDLFRGLAAEEDRAVRAALCEALGKRGDASAVPLLLVALDERSPLLQPAAVPEAAAVALGRMSMRNIEEARTPEVVALLLDQLGRLDRNARRGAAFAVARIQPSALPEPVEARLLEAALHDADPVVRAFLLRAAGSLDLSPEQVDALLGQSSRDADRGVRVATARVAASLQWHGVTSMLDDAVLGVRLVAVESMGQIESLDATEILTGLVAAGSTGEAAEAARTQGDPRLLLAAKAVRALAESDFDPTAYLDSRRPTAIRVAAAEIASDPERLLTLATKDGEAGVRTTSAMRLVELGATPEQLIAMLAAFDAQVAAIAAEWLVEHPDPAAEGELLQAIADTDDIDMLRIGAKAMVALYGSNRPLIKKPLPAAGPTAVRLLGHQVAVVRDEASPLARALGVQAPETHPRELGVSLARLERLQGARITTTEGEFFVDFFPEEAPITVSNWVKLAEDGYFDRLRIHRVVPDFVVQDGDPRGDGAGGPGYAIPDEINPLHYREGTIGMALAGPDTGGSQWFVTLSPQPHLDGGYTIFGEVRRGMQVVRSLHEGSVITRVQIEWGPEPEPPPAADAVAPVDLRPSEDATTPSP